MIPLSRLSYSLLHTIGFISELRVAADELRRGGATVRLAIPTGGEAVIAVSYGHADKIAGEQPVLRRRWEGASSQRAYAQADIVLATIHVRAGEPDGLRLAHHPLTGVMMLSSVRSRHQLSPLGRCLDSRPRSDAGSWRGWPEPPRGGSCPCPS